MVRVIRNTVFTVLVIWLSAYALKWNHAANEPTSLERAVLAASHFADSQDKPFDLSVKAEKDIVKLGQVQLITIKTLPNADLDIVTLLPGNIISDEFSTKAKADSQGNYEFKVKISNFKSLGLIQITVAATAGNKVAEESTRYILQAWSLPQVVEQGDYQFPLIP